MARAVKRSIDLIVALLALVVLAPVLGAVALAIRLRMGAPVLFRQVRPGYRGNPFVLVKFRTMLPPRNLEEEMLYDDRLTRLGRFLRKTSLDELPELFNVLKGDLSLVGPRPLMPEYLPLYNDEQSRRHDVRPGITGWAQINGRDAIQMEQRFEYDVWYVDNWSLWLDLKIFIRTLWQVIARKGTGHDGAPAVPLWQGNSDGGAERPAGETKPGERGQTRPDDADPHGGQRRHGQVSSA